MCVCVYTIANMKTSPEGLNSVFEQKEEKKWIWSRPIEIIQSERRIKQKEKRMKMKMNRAAETGHNQTYVLDENVPSLMKK